MGLYVTEYIVMGGENVIFFDNTSYPFPRILADYQLTETEWRIYASVI